LNNDGEVECDAMIMDGQTMKTGIWMYNIIGILGADYMVPSWPG
jgi:isoaspartyl peptidase/L-asparaginase-like protein (Ntn-hydrolase superfamily)